jgi:outer membrane protein
MKKAGFLVGAFAAVLYVFSSSWVYAAEKTGFINVQDVILGTDVGKKADEDFKKMVDNKRSLIQERETELKRLKDEIERQGSILTESARKEKEAVQQGKFLDYQRIVKEANDEVTAKRHELVDKMIPDIMKIVNEIGEKEKYTLIIDLNIVPVAYFSKENDLTKRVIEQANKVFNAKK